MAIVNIATKSTRLTLHPGGNGHRESRPTVGLIAVKQNIWVIVSGAVCAKESERTELTIKLVMHIQ